MKMIRRLNPAHHRQPQLVTVGQVFWFTAVLCSKEKNDSISALSATESTRPMECRNFKHPEAWRQSWDKTGIHDSHDDTIFHDTLPGNLVGRRVESQLGCHPVRYRTPHNASVENIIYRAEVKFARTGLDSSHLRNTLSVRVCVGRTAEGWDVRRCRSATTGWGSG